MTVEEILDREGGVAPTALLLERGCSSSDLRRAVRNGTAWHPRRGWLAVVGAPPEHLQLAQSGARLTCVSALALRDVWCPSNPGRHVRVPVGRRRMPPARGLVIHRADGRDSDPVVDGVAGSLKLAVRCLPRNDAIAVLDSVVERGLLWKTDIVDLLEAMPRKYAVYASLMDPGAQSGLETHVRLGCRALRVRCRSQVPIPGVGFVDFVIGDRLVIEVDGLKYHATPETFREDRRRGLVLRELGYLELRLTYQQAMYEWPRVAQLIRDLVARGEHRWSGAHRRAGLVTL